MARHTAVTIRLTEDDLARPGIHCLPDRVRSFLSDQFGLDVVIRIEDDRGSVISESVPGFMHEAPLDIHGEGYIGIPKVWEDANPELPAIDTAGLIGN